MTIFVTVLFLGLIVLFLWYFQRDEERKLTILRAFAADAAWTDVRRPSFAFWRTPFYGGTMITGRWNAHRTQAQVFETGTTQSGIPLQSARNHKTWMRTWIDTAANPPKTTIRAHTAGWLNLPVVAFTEGHEIHLVNSPLRGVVTILSQRWWPIEDALMDFDVGEEIATALLNGEIHIRPDGLDLTVQVLADRSDAEALHIAWRAAVALERSIASAAEPRNNVPASNV